ncbi:MAG: GNAT family N-acetyltransferase [Isosphaeraceae bacterium]|nr:GNAT family N-acetyltransferase [Isosphaeraceae bacterium]
MPVVLVGTLDTKGHEVAFVGRILERYGLEVLVIDAGSVGPPAFAPDIDRQRVFSRAGISDEEIRARGDRGEAVAAAARGVAAIVTDLAFQGQVEGILALGGSAGTTIGTAAMRALPFGVPKVMVSTLASGQMRPFVGGSDILMLHSVADLAGLNRLTRTVLTNAANALAGMVRPDLLTVGIRELSLASDVIEVEEPSRDRFRRVVAEAEDEAKREDRPVIAATMFGVTTPCVDRARRVLETLGCEVLVFHATGVGGQAMEGLIRDGQVAGVLDLTTTELADELVGGILSAGPERLEAAGRRGLAQVVSVGALDMVNFGPLSTVPERFRGRKLHQHNPNVTLMRTTPEENAALGARIAEALGRARGPTALLIPKGGVSALDAPGQPFWDPQADAALFQALRDGLAGHPKVRLVEREEHINDPAFADLAARMLLELIREQDPQILEHDRITTSWAKEADMEELRGFLRSVGLSDAGIAEALDGFLLARGPGGRLLGCAGLERHGGLALLRSVAVAPEVRGYGLGSRLAATLLNRAAADGIEEVILLTTAAHDFFRRLGFREASRDDYRPRLAEAWVWRQGPCEAVTLMVRNLIEKTPEVTWLS